MNRLARLLAAAALATALGACSTVSAVTPTGPAAPATGGAVASGSVVHIDAKDIAFSESQVQAPANLPFQIVFTSSDSAPHNVTIVGADGSTKFSGDIVNGPGSTTYSVPALPPGSYTFRCDIHPSMTGTLIVQ